MTPERALDYESLFQAAKHLRAEGRTKSFIATKLGYSKDTITSWFKLGYAGKRPVPQSSPWTEDLIERLRVLWADGKSASEIAMSLRSGMSRNAVISKVHRLGLPGRAPVVPKPKPGRTPTTRYRPYKPRPTPIFKIVPLPEPEPPAPDVTPDRCGAGNAIASLSTGQCHWPIGHPHAPDFHFCARQVNKDFAVYCSEHRAKAYTPFGRGAA